MKKVGLIFLSLWLIISSGIGIVSCQKNDNNSAKYHVLSVGNGIFSYVQVGNKAIVLDAGRGLNQSNDYYSNLNDEDLTLIYPTYRQHWDFIENDFKKNQVEEIEAIFISHNHFDHYFYLITMIKRFKVNNLVMPYPTLSANKKNHVQETIDALKFGKLKKYFQGKILTEFQRFYTFLKIDFENLTSYLDENDLKKTALYDNPNSTSLILRFYLANHYILFTGDAENNEVELSNKIILKKLKEYPIDVYFVPHHGSNNSANRRILDVIGANVKYVIISGTDNTNEWKDFANDLRFPKYGVLADLHQKAVQAKIYVTGNLDDYPENSNDERYDWELIKSYVEKWNHSYTFDFKKENRWKYYLEVKFNFLTIANYQKFNKFIIDNSLYFLRK